MNIIKCLVNLALLTICTFSVAQNSNEIALSQQASICLNSSNTLELMVNGKNSGAIDRKKAISKIIESSLPIAQKHSLIGLMSLIYSAQDLSGATEKLSAKQIAINYYLSCMSVR